MFGRKKKEPSAEDVSKMERDRTLEAHYATDPIEDLASTPAGVAFEYRVSEDENMLSLFKENPWLDSLYPLFSRLNFLSNCSERSARLYMMKVRRIITRLSYRRKSVEDKDLLDSLETFFNMRINDSVHGWKVDKLTTQRRYLEIGEQNKKKGWLK